ncbi:MAG: hypothetical protein IH608_02615, partial [Proteobacteria bacterium]|nr:hypothetical protein [Pseudomonadota bacterium]
YQYNANDGHLLTDCIACHRHDFDNEYGANSQDAFMVGCDSCHGFPPTPGTQNYAGGGGAHALHVAFLKSKVADSVDPQLICGPCHGDGAGNTNHNDSNNGPGSWPTAARNWVNIQVRATGNSWDGLQPSDPLTARYGNQSLPTVAGAGSDTICSGVDCHGNPDRNEALSWPATEGVTDTSNTSDALEKSQVCQGCHNGLQSRAQARVYNKAGALVYPANLTSGLSMDSATNYYGTLSGFSRGGHGDTQIGSTSDPSWGESPDIQSGLTLPLDCTACHSSAAPHFDLPSVTNHRLDTARASDSNNRINSLCTSNGCHEQADDLQNGLPKYHHRTNMDMDWAFSEPSGVNYDVPIQGDVDEFVQYWANPGTYTQIGNPSQVDLPFREDIFLSLTPQITGGFVVCTTCHQPHGADLAVNTAGMAGGNYEQIPDNDMLRLRYERDGGDETLCEACHNR